MPAKLPSKARIEFIRRKLESLFPKTEAPLVHQDPFSLLVAVVLSAQTTDKKVNEVTPALFRKAPDPKSMAALSIEEIHAFIKVLGLAPQKAKALSGLSKMLIEEFGGEVPRDRESLERLPGVGRKTASVVLAQAFGIAAFPVDTHIHRLALRWGLSSSQNVRQVEEDLKKLYPEELWNKFHLQIIFYGRQYCGARQCDATRCEICAWCRSEEEKLKRRGPKSSKARTRSPKSKISSKRNS